jgi:uncharacterized protein (DUF952 family)
MIYHIAKNSDWMKSKSTEQYTPADFEKDGYIHCSDDSQIERVANWLFKGQKDLVLLQIDPTKLKAQTIYENPYDKIAEKFPHVHGPINLNAVINVFPLPCDSTGQFKFNFQS